MPSGTSINKKKPVQAHMKDFFSEAPQKKLNVPLQVVCPMWRQEPSGHTENCKSKLTFRTSRALRHHCCALRDYMFLHRLVLTEQIHQFPPTSVAHYINRKLHLMFIQFSMPGGDWTGAHQELHAKKSSTNTLVNNINT